MAVVLTNNAETTLAAGISAVDTSLTVAAGQGALFPNPGASDWFPLLLIKADGSAYEIVRAVSRAGDGISIERAREGTTAIAFDALDIVSHRATAEALLALASSSSTDVPLSTSGGSNKYVVSLPDVSAYADGLRVAFRAHVASTGAVTLKVNSLAEIDITTESGAAIAAADIATGQFVECVYDSGSGDFIIDEIRYPTSSTNEAGYAQRGIEQSFNINGDNTKFVTHQNASRIAEAAVASGLSTFSQTQIPTAYSNTGNGAGGSTTFGGSTAFSCGREYQYANMTFPNGSTLNMIQEGVVVLRVTGKFLMESGAKINFCNAPAGDHSRENIGPIGSSFPPGPGVNTVRRGTLVNGIGADGSRLTVNQFAGFVYDGAPMHLWHGNHGSADNTQRIPISGKGGLIIICDEFEMEAGVQVEGMHAEPGAGLQSGASGGVILVSTQTSFVDGATYEAGAVGNFRLASVWNGLANEVVDAHAPLSEIGNGQFFHVDRSNANFTLIF